MFALVSLRPRGQLLGTRRTFEQRRRDLYNIIFGEDAFELSDQLRELQLFRKHQRVGATLRRLFQHPLRLPVVQTIVEMVLQIIGEPDQ